MIRTARPALFAVLSMSLFAAACGGDDHNTAKFSTADEVHLRRTLDVVRAGDAASLNLIGVFVSGANQIGCPSIVTTGTVTTITADCTNEDGVRLSGRIVTTNFESHTGYDASKPSVVEAEDWRATTVDGDEWIDGKVTVTPTGTEAARGALIDAVTDAHLEGVTVHTDLGFDCDPSELCVITGGSWVDVDGVGAADVAGSFRYDEAPTGEITATGAETLVIDIPASVDGCVVFRIDGARHELCESESKPSARRVPSPFAFAGDARLMLPLAR